MASRKNEKEARKQARIEAEATEAAEQRRKKMLYAVGAAGLAAVIVVVALVAVSQSGGDGDDGGGGSLSGVSEVEGELSGVPQTGTVLGAEDAEVTIKEFGDLQCPACAQFSEAVVPEIISGPVAADDAKLEFLNFTILGPDSEIAARAALAASEQGRYWQFVELFYRNQGVENSGFVTDEFLTEIAEGAGVADIDAWNESREEPKWDARLARIQAEASELGLTGTPSIVVEGPGGTEVLGTPGSVAEIEGAVSRVG